MSIELTVRFRSISDLNRDMVDWAPRVADRYALIVGVPRSGLMAATILALHSHLPVMDLRTFLSGQDEWSGHRLKHRQSGRVLILDDTLATGLEMSRVRAAVASAGIDDTGVEFGAAYVAPESTKLLDTYYSVLPRPRIFEWNIMHDEGTLAGACMDIDGVLCADPTDIENDDGLRYDSFLKNARRIYKPTHKVHSLVTSRLEKYRPQTEDWLSRAGVSYDRLIMLDLPSAEERRRLRAHATHKAQAYDESGARIFIESSRTEAEEIHRLTDKPVYVPSLGLYLGDGARHDYRDSPSERTARAASRVRRFAGKIKRRALGA